MGTFSRVEGFRSIEELKEATIKCFPNIDWEYFMVLRLNKQYYAVTMKNVDFGIVVSKKYVRFYKRPYLMKTADTKTFVDKTSHPGFSGGRTYWNSKVIADYWMACNMEAELVQKGILAKGHRTTLHNAKVLLLLLLCNETRFSKQTYK